MNPVVRSRLVWLLPAVFTLCWLVFVLANDHLDRVTGHWRTSATMVLGGFISGSTPQGSSSVAFPVFTKALDILGPTPRPW
jgi:hypothetical protein